MAKRIDLYFVKEHLRNAMLYYIFIGIFALAGIGVGLFISLTGYKYTALLSAADRNMFSYITGTASYISIFYSRLINIALCFLIVFALSLSRYTAPLGYLFLGYQMSLVVLTGAALITRFGLAGVFNFILFILPLNILNFAVLGVELASGLERAHAQGLYKLKFLESARETNYFKKLGLCAVVLIALCLVSSFLLPLVVRSFVVINF